MEPSEGFAPIAHADARYLVLGSLPGRQSLAAGEYYAHSRNAFWPIMDAVLGAAGDYDERCQVLQQAGVAVWDVLKSAERPGSLDSSIRQEHAIVNNFNELFDKCRMIRRVLFNGRTAERLFTRRVELPEGRRIRTIALPSTSPAYAALSFDAKLAAWRVALTG